MRAEIDTSQILILKDFFNDLSTINQRRIFLASFRKSAKPLVQNAKALAPKGRTGNLEKSIGIMAVGGETAILVGARKGGYKGWHGHLIENGTVERFRRTKKNAPTGSMTASNFFEKAYDATANQMFDTMEEEWLTAIDNMIIRTNRKLSK